MHSFLKGRGCESPETLVNENEIDHNKSREVFLPRFVEPLLFVSVACNIKALISNQDSRCLGMDSSFNRSVNG